MLFTREDLQQSWSPACSSEEATKLLQQKLAAPAFFVDQGSLGFCKATCQETSKQRIVLSGAAAQQIQQQLEELLHVTLPPPQQHYTYCNPQPVDIPDAKAYYQLVNSMRKEDKAAAKQGKLKEAIAALERARSLVGPSRPAGSPLAVCLALDVEWWELDKEVVLELGWSLWDSASACHRTRHWQVLENMHRCNGRHVVDNRSRFLFAPAGTRSSLGSCQEAVAALQRELDQRGLLLLPGDPPECQQALSQASASEVVFLLVGHGLSVDLQQCDALGLALPQQLEALDTQLLAWAALWPQQQQAGEDSGNGTGSGGGLSGADAASSSSSSRGAAGTASGSGTGSGSGDGGGSSGRAGAIGGTTSSSQQDGGRAAAGANGSSRSKRRGPKGGENDVVAAAGPPKSPNSHQVALKNLLELLGIKPARLHNAGNDARFTMEAFLALAGHPPCTDPAGQHAAAVAPPAPSLEDQAWPALHQQQQQQTAAAPAATSAGWGPAPAGLEAGHEGW